MARLSLLHIIIIATSNIAVTFPFTFCGFHSTYGVFTFPLIFIITDLTARLMGKKAARNTVLISMIPGFIISYIFTVYSNSGSLIIINDINILALRIAFASFSAYLFGQLLDITVFSFFRSNYSWWVAPSISSFIGEFFDSFIFFSLAFYNSSNEFLRDNWQEIAFVDFFFKFFITIIIFLPFYGKILTALLRKKEGLIIQ